MKKLTFTLAAFFMAAMASAQFVRIEVEQVPNGGKVPGNTYRIYAVMENPNDIIDAVFADEKNPLEISSTKTFYQHPQGGALSADIMRFDVQNDAKLSFDSWFTIGAEDNYNNYLMPFLMDSVDVKPFEAGDNFFSTTCAWFATPDRRQTFAPSNGKILLMQLTTPGKVTGKINIHGRTRAVLDADGNIVSGGEVFEIRDIAFTCG